MEEDIMDKKMKRFIYLMEKEGMSPETIYWAIYLMKGDPQIDKVIHFLEIYPGEIVDYDLRMKIAHLKAKSR